MPAQVVGTGKGTVKFFNSQKGFGFIQQETGGEDVFVHISAVERAGLEGLAEGQELEFNLVDRGGKVSAADLQIVGDVIPVESRGPAAGSRDEAPRRQLTGEKATGTVKFFNSMKGFGFLTRDDGKTMRLCISARSSVRACRESTRASVTSSISKSIGAASSPPSIWFRRRTDPLAQRRFDRVRARA